MKASRGILFILLVAAFLRIWGVAFGLPDLYHADEPALVNHALAHGTGDLNPHYFKLPAFLNYFLLFFYGIYFLLGRAIGWFPSQEAFVRLFLEDPSSFYLIGRIFTGVLFGVLGVFLIYRLGRALFSERIALTAAFFLSCAFLHVRDSHYVIYDVPLTAALTACFLVLTHLIQKGKAGSYFIFGILAGLAISIKYNAALVLFPFFLAHTFTVFKRKESLINLFFSPPLIAGLVAAFLMFLLTNPFFVLDFHSFWKDFLVQAGAETPMGMLHHLRYSLREGMGAPLLITGLLGILFLLSSKESAQIILAFFVVLWLFYLSLFSQPYERYALPALPFLCLSAAVALSRIFQWLHLETRRVAWFIFSFLLVLPSFARSVYCDFLFAQPDTRTLSREWVEANLAKGSTVALDYPFHLPRLRFDKEELTRKRDEIKGPQSDTNRERLNLLIEGYDEKRPHYRLFFLDDGDGVNRPLFSRPTVGFRWEDLTKEKIRYVLLTRLTSEYEHPDFYETLKKKAVLVKTFTPFRDASRAWGLARWRQAAAATEGRDLFARDRFGDIIEIYQLPS